MKFEQYIRNFKRFRNQLPQYFFNLLKQYAAHDVVGQIEHRVTTTGVAADGRKFSPYSTKPFWTTGRMGKSDRLRKWAFSNENVKWMTVKYGDKNIHLFQVPGGYKQARQIEGLETSFKNFEFSGQMWRMFGVKRSATSKNNVRVWIGGRTRRSQRLINENSKRENKPIIDMSKKEIDIMEKVVDKEIQRLLQKHGAA